MNSAETWRGGRWVSRAAQWAVRHDLNFVVPLLSAVLALQFSPVLLHAGWPLNHEGLTWKYRLAIYAAHFRRFDLLPIWSESAAFGLGAPVPLIYHKLFYVPAVPVYLLTGSVKASVIISLGAFSVLGVCGVRAVLQRFGVPARAGLIAAASLLFCNYSYTDWLVRGAFAEYSGMFLLPWLLDWLLGAVQGDAARRLLRQGSWVFPALYLAHSGLFFFAAVPVIAAVCWRLTLGRDRRAFGGALLAIAGIFSLITAPIVIAQLLVIENLSFAEGIAIYDPRDHFASLERHLSGGDYVWGKTWEGLSVQLDLPLVGLALLGLLVVLKAETGRLGKSAAPSALNARGAVLAYAACWLVFAYFMFWLRPVAGPLYSLPGFSTLQFPWRLLSFVSVLSVVLASTPMLLATGPEGHPSATRGASVLLLVTLVSSPLMHPIRYGWFSPAELEAPLPATAGLQLGGFEYHPKVEGVPGPRLVEYTNRLSPRPDAAAWSAAGCSVQRIDSPAFERGRRRYQVQAGEPATLVLPIAYSPYIRVDLLADGARERVPTYRLPDDPRLHVAVPAGSSELRVKYPTLVSLVADLL